MKNIRRDRAHFASASPCWKLRSPMQRPKRNPSSRHIHRSARRLHDQLQRIDITPPLPRSIVSQVRCFDCGTTKMESFHTLNTGRLPSLPELLSATPPHGARSDRRTDLHIPRPARYLTHLTRWHGRAPLPAAAASPEPPTTPYTAMLSTSRKRYPGYGPEHSVELRIDQQKLWGAEPCLQICPWHCPRAITSD